MGNGIGKLFLCSSGTCAGDASGNLENSSAFISKQHDKAIGNSLCYVRPIPPRFSGDSLSDDETTVMTFRSVTGATVSANSSATPSIFLDDSLQHSTILDSSASFESFGSFASTMVPFQYQLHHQHHQNQHAPIKRSLKKILSRAFLSLGKKSILKKNDNANANARVSCSNSLSGELRLQGDDDDDDDDDSSECDDLLMVCKDLHWAQGKAGEDRMHIVICENHEWVFVGIYDGFNGPDATDYLLNNLFYTVYDELKELLCNHNDVLKDNDVLQCLSEALRKTEETFLTNVNEMITHNPVLAMMGSCVLVMLMKGEDVYLMNVGDSRAVLATHTGNSLQLTMEHSTHVKEEVCRIRGEHPEDPSAVTKGRVKGCLNVTRAFGAGFLKQPKQNNAVLEIFKVSYIGESPYITCSPSLHHQRLSPNDKFLILSSDGLYQYFTNEEAVAKVESFITMFPDKDPAQFLIEEALSRAAKKAGLEFHELLDIPQGERRLYHDDISIIIVSFEGKIWHSLV